MTIRSGCEIPCNPIRRVPPCPISKFPEGRGQGAALYSDINLEKNGSRYRCSASRRVFRRDFVAAAPLLFQLIPLFSERIRELLRRGQDERVRILHSPTRFINEARLNRVPARAKLVTLLLRQERLRVLRLLRRSLSTGIGRVSAFIVSRGSSKCFSDRNLQANHRTGFCNEGRLFLQLVRSRPPRFGVARESWHASRYRSAC